MSRKLIIRNRATQDLRQQANYIFSNGSVGAAEHFLELAEATFAQILMVPRIGKSVNFLLFNCLMMRSTLNLQILSVVTSH
jgi:toxin ParE1/3/4